MHCNDCYFHATHATSYQCKLQQLVGKGLIRIIEHPTTIETRFYEHTSYRSDDRYIAKSIVPRNTSPRHEGPFVIIDLPMDSVFLQSLPIHADPSEPTHCTIVIHEMAYDH